MMRLMVGAVVRDTAWLKGSGRKYGQAFVVYIDELECIVVHGRVCG
jgi:hypothetical protein